jgi:hypothetical protein
LLAAEQAAQAQRRISDALSRMAAPHSLFIRILSARLTEARTLRGLWAAPGGDRGFLEALRWLHQSCHESVAVDVLHAAAGCSGRMRLEAGSDDEGGGGGGGGDATAQLVGGIPVWRWPTYADVEWSAYLCPVLESLLYTCYEDYIVVALAAVGHALEAVTPLFEAARGCSDADLADASLWPGGDAAADSDGEGGSGEAGSGRCADDRSRAHTAATQAVQFVRNAFPLLPALASVASYGGRVEKLAHLRAARLQQLNHSVEHLLLTSTHALALGEGAAAAAAWADEPAGRGGKPVSRPGRSAAAAAVPRQSRRAGGGQYQPGPVRGGGGGGGDEGGEEVDDGASDGSAEAKRG